MLSSWLSILKLFIHLRVHHMDLMYLLAPDVQMLDVACRSTSRGEGQCNTRFIKGHKPINHIRARIKSHVYTTECTVYHSTYYVKRYNKVKYECYLLY